MTEETRLIQLERTARFDGPICNKTCDHLIFTDTGYRCRLYVKKLYTTWPTEYPIASRCPKCKYDFGCANPIIV